MVICAYVSSEGGHRPVAFKEELQVSTGSWVGGRVGGRAGGGGVKSMYHCHQHWQEREREKQTSTFIISTDCCVSSPVHIAERDLLFKRQRVCVGGGGCMWVCVWERESTRVRHVLMTDACEDYDFCVPLEVFSTSMKIRCRTKRDVGYRGQSYLFIWQLHAWQLDFNRGRCGCSSALFFACFFFLFFPFFFKAVWAVFCFVPYSCWWQFLNYMARVLSFLTYDHD